MGRGRDDVERFNVNTETSHLFLFCFIVWVFCIAAKLSSSLQLLPVLDLVHGWVWSRCLPLVSQQSFLLISALWWSASLPEVADKVIFIDLASLWNEWSVSPWQQVKGMQIIIWDMKEEKKQLLFFFSCLILSLYSPCPLSNLLYQKHLNKAKSSRQMFAIGISNH